MDRVLYRTLLVFCILTCVAPSTQAQTIAEKKAGVAPAGTDLTRDMQSVLVQINKELMENQTTLQSLYQQVQEMYYNRAPEEEFREVLERINVIKTEIQTLENNWRDMATHTAGQAGYALWHQPESTLGQLVNDYGAQNYVYIMAPEIANIKVSVDSNIPIPRASWNELMEQILNQNGVGIKQLNPYLRQLYLIRHDRSGIRLITNNRRELEFLPPEARVCFVLSPEPSDVRRIWAFLDKFVNPSSTVLQMVGRDILIIASVAEVQDLLKLYDFVEANRGDKDYRIRTLTRVNAEEMGKILAAIFDQLVESPRTNGGGPQDRPSPTGGGAHGGQSPTGRGLIDIARERRDAAASADVNGLKIIPLTHIAQAIFLVGTKEEIRKADEIISQVENQVGEAREKIIWWYRTKHSDPEELGQVLDKIYNLMIATGTGFERVKEGQKQQVQQLIDRQEDIERIQQDYAESRPPLYAPELPNPFLPSRLYQNDFYQQGGYVVNPAPVEPRAIPQVIPNRNRNNFLVDLKTSSIVMVVEADILPKMKEIIRKLDVPKTMVQIEALIVEKRLTRQDNFGLNLLRIGDAASNTNVGSLIFNNIIAPKRNENQRVTERGIFEFLLSRKEDHGIPAFDISYRFLIDQADVSINANPTVVTVNQVPAKIAIVEEISINTGIFLVDTVKGVTPENAFTRAQYGLTIIVNPTIHVNDDPDSTDDIEDYVTLDTDITFDTVQPSTLAHQPNVQRRHVTNQVRIPDGQTVIIGGLRRKNQDDSKESVPYLGEIPGFGKLFSFTTMHEDSVELFIFLTPKIIKNPCADFERIKMEEMLRRPGDIPEFMCVMVEAHDAEKNRLFAGTMNALFGWPPECCVPEPYSCWPLKEYDGR